MDVKECFEKGLLKRDVKSMAKASRSIQIAKNKLVLSKRSFDANIYEDTIMNAYASMFHAARALLFKDGVVEKSHYGLFIYIKEVYSNKLEPRFINELNALRLERHELLYGLEEIKVTREEAEDILSIAKEFVSTMEKILK